MMCICDVYRARLMPNFSVTCMLGYLIEIPCFIY